MKTRILFISTLMFVFLSLTYSQFSKQQAIDTVINYVIVADTGLVNVFVSNNTYSSSEILLLEHYDSITFGFTESWVFFVDDLPLANWHHPCRYIAVSAASGEYEIIPQSIYPFELETDFELIHQLDFKPYINISPLEGTATGKIQNSAEPNPNLFAVLITGANDTKEFWNDISNIYCTLTQVYGYKKENIFVHYVNEETGTQNGQDLDGDEIQSDDIDYCSRLDTLKRTFLNLGGIAGPLYDPTIPELNPEDQLFVFINGHGGVYSSTNNSSYLSIVGTGWNNKLYDTTFANWLQYINCAQMIFVMEPCYSGGFIDDITDYENYQVQCENREIHTACEFEPSMPEVWVTLEDSVTPTLTTVKFGEFVFYWTAAVRGYYPDFDEPWNVYLNFPTGTFPLESFFPDSLNHPGDYDPDINGDGIIQMGEAFLYADSLDSWSPYGFYGPHEVAPDFEEHPDKEKVIDFQEDLLSLYGLSGEIMSNQSVQGNFAIGGPLTLSQNATLLLKSNTNLYFINDYVTIDDEAVAVRFTIPSNHNLIFQNDVSVYGLGNPNSIDVYGDIEFGHNNRFLSLSGNYWKGINFMNEDANVLIEDATFVKCGIAGFLKYLNLDSLDFSYGFIDIEKANVDLKNSDFYFSNFKALYGGSTSYINIKNSTFNHSLTDAVYIDSYYSYEVDNCSISHCLSGIRVFNSGGSLTADISNNEINNNNKDGVLIYNSYASFIVNNINNNNGDGISLYDYSYISLFGNKDAHFVSETQRFRDNGMYEIFADDGSFPEEFKWNAVIDEDNETDGYELVYCETKLSKERDVRYNYWGSEENFNPQNDFYPYEDYTYLPKFKLEDDEDDSGIAETLFYSAENDFKQGNYSEAKNEYQQVIEQYPESKFAKASIKQLFSVEEYEANDYNSLKQYLLSNSIILSNPVLEKLADFFANKCNIKLENWQTAIDWFEYEIQNPESFADSLYAIIDLGNTYLLMEQSGYKSSYSGNMIEHMPISTEQHIVKRDFLISLLPQDNLSKTMKENLSKLNEGELLQNVPNPFKGSTQIWYNLNGESNVQLTVYNYFGQLISTINEETKTEGIHYIEFDANGLKNGLYFYLLIINGQTTDSKKMIIVE